MKQYHGGTNFGRTAGGPFITTSYDYDAPLDEYGKNQNLQALFPRSDMSSTWFLLGVSDDLNMHRCSASISLSKILQPQNDEFC